MSTYPPDPHGYDQQQKSHHRRDGRDKVTQRSNEEIGIAIGLCGNTQESEVTCDRKRN